MNSYFYLWNIAGIAASVNNITAVFFSPSLSVMQVALFFKMILLMSAHSQHKTNQSLFSHLQSKPFFFLPFIFVLYEQQTSTGVKMFWEEI